MPYAVIAVLLARKIFCVRWSGLLCNLYSMLPISVLFMAVYEVERALAIILFPLVCGGLGRYDFHRRSGFTAQSGVPQHEYAAIKMVAMALFEDLPQLAVQSWVWFYLPAASSLSTLTFLFSIAVTSADLAVCGYAVWRQAKALDGISLLRYVGYVFGLVLPGDDFARAFARQIAAGTYPGEVLMLNGGGVTDDGAIAIARALRRAAAREAAGHTGRTLVRKLDLNTNGVGDAGAAALAGALEAEGCPLEGLNLCENPAITDGAGGGYAALSAALEANATLRTLRLGGEAAGGAAMGRVRREDFKARFGSRVLIVGSE